MIDLLKNKLAVTLSQAVQSLGPLPNEDGEFVRRVMGGSDEIAVMALGCYLEDCIRKKDFSPLGRARRDIPMVKP